MDVGQIRELIKILESSEVTEVVVEEGDTRVVVRKGGFGSVESMAAPAAPAAGSAPAAEPEKAVERPVTWKGVIAPMVGTFYSAPSPGADPFVAVGDAVTPGQPLCILEEMKLMNEITAEEPGVIREICASNADAVEYGTVLFYFEP